MLETTSAAEGERLGVDFAEVYQRSPLAMYGSLHETPFHHVQRWGVLCVVSVRLC